MCACVQDRAASAREDNVESRLRASIVQVQEKISYNIAASVCMCVCVKVQEKVS